MGFFGDAGELLRNSSEFYGILMDFQDSLGFLWISRILWDSLGFSEILWDLLRFSRILGDSWRFLEILGDS